jgi:hypothetical protein
MKISSQVSSPALDLHTADVGREEAAKVFHETGARQGGARSSSARMGQSRPAWLVKTVRFVEKTLPGKGERLTASIQRHLASRWMNDRTSAFEHIGSSSYAQRRRQQMHAIPGAGYLARQYGLQTVRNVPSVIDDGRPQTVATPGLTMEHDHSATYQRDVPAQQLQQQCMEFYRHKGHTCPNTYVLFVNSQTNATRLLAKLKENEQKSLSRMAHLKLAFKSARTTPKIVPLESGLVAIEFKNERDIEPAGDLVNLLGCRPSIFKADKLAYQAWHAIPPSSTKPNTNKPGKTLQQLLTEDPQDNRPALQDLLDNQIPQVISALRQWPDDHAMQSVADGVASLLGGLKQSVGDKIDRPDVRYDALIANAVESLAATARILPTLSKDATLCFSAYAALIEELNLLLAAIRPYDAGDFKLAAADMFQARYGPALERLRIAPPETYLLSSGMEAISMGVDVARKLTGTKRTQLLSNAKPSPDYFETPQLCSKGYWNDADRIRMAPLNSSSPRRMDAADSYNKWNADKLLNETIAWLDAGKMSKDDPGVLVLDATIEKKEGDSRSELNRVLDRLGPYINDGKLKLVLCKSYQKYASLGSAKIMAGGITILAKDDEKTRAGAQSMEAAEKDLDWMSNDESQLLTHIMKHAQDNELSSLDAAAKNAAFADRLCFRNVRENERGKIRREDGLPFLLVNTPIVRQGMAMMSHQVELRDSFGFLGTSMLKIGSNLIRLTAGRESREEIVEKLYGVGWLVENDHGRPNPAAALEKIARIAIDALQAVQQETDVTAWAPVALQVLRKRLDGADSPQVQALARCANLLEQINATPAPRSAALESTLSLRKKALKQELEMLLHTSEPLAHDLISDQLSIVGSAFAPRLPDAIRSTDDVGAMRAAMQRTTELAHEQTIPSERLERARYASNAVASILSISSKLFPQSSLSNGDIQQLEALYTLGLESGLSGVSPTTRAHIVKDWAELHCYYLNASDPLQQKEAADELIRHLRLSPYRETGARILADIPDETFVRLEEPVRRRLLDAMFAPLDVQSRLLLLRVLVDGQSTAKLSACIAHFDRDLDRPDLLMPDHLADGAGRRSDQLRPLTQDKREAIRAELQSHREALAAIPESAPN